MKSVVNEIFSYIPLLYYEVFEALQNGAIIYVLSAVSVKQFVFPSA